MPVMWNIASPVKRIKCYSLSDFHCKAVNIQAAIAAGCIQKVMHQYIYKTYLKESWL